jgi:hypothetical protein
MANFNQTTVTGLMSFRAIFVAINEAPQAITEKSASRREMMYFFKIDLSGVSCDLIEALITASSVEIMREFEKPIQ